jgi:hypothetical protein
VSCCCCCRTCLPLPDAADGSAHGVFFLNSNGMDVVLNKDSVTYKCVSGLGRQQLGGCGVSWQ